MRKPLIFYIAKEMTLAQKKSVSREDQSLLNAAYAAFNGKATTQEIILKTCAQAMGRSPAFQRFGYEYVCKNPAQIIKDGIEDVLQTEARKQKTSDKVQATLRRNISSKFEIEIGEVAKMVRRPVSEIRQSVIGQGTLMGEPVSSRIVRGKLMVSITNLERLRDFYAAAPSAD